MKGRFGGSGHRRGLAAIVALAVCLMLAGCSLRPSEPKTARPSTAPTSTATPTPADLHTAEINNRRPNIVLVQVDDMSTELLATMATVARMQAQGATYPHSFVTDSLCCVSRASLMTGQFPHQTGVLTNTSSTKSEPDETGATQILGGWPAFTANHNEIRSFNVTLQQAGYETGFVGKYLNEYEYHPQSGELPPVPPGWDRFNVVYGSAYDGWGFDLLAGDEETLTHVDLPSYSATDEEKDAAYAGTVIAEQALDFITKHRDDDRPFYLQVEPYAPHNRTNPQGAWPDEPLFPAAFADRKTSEHPGNCGAIACQKLTAQTLPGFNTAADRGPVDGKGQPTRDWNSNPPAPIGPVRAAALLRQRAQMLQSVDRMLSDILDAVDDNTFVVFTSDNGLHINQAGLGFGKGTAYRSDIQVPLVVIGPGVLPGVRDEIAMNIDLSATFEDLAGVAPVAFRAGQSLLPSLKDPGVARRKLAIVEHTAQSLGTDPDQIFTGGDLAKIPSYVAVRTRDAVLIRSDVDPRFEVTKLGYQFFSYAGQPPGREFEGANTFARDRRTPQVRALLTVLKAWDDCQSSTGSAPVLQRCRDLLTTR